MRMSHEPTRDNSGSPPGFRNLKTAIRRVPDRPPAPGSIQGPPYFFSCGARRERRLERTNQPHATPADCTDAHPIDSIFASQDRDHGRCQLVGNGFQFNDHAKIGKPLQDVRQGGNANAAASERRASRVPKVIPGVGTSEFLGCPM
jgi:hypothetical protein